MAVLTGGVGPLAGRGSVVVEGASCVVGVVGASSMTMSDSGGFLSPTCTMVLLKLHCDGSEATLSAFVAMVRGGSGGGSPTRLTLLLLFASCCLSSSDVEEAVHEDEPHFLLTVLGMLQLSKYLMMLSRQLICWYE